MIISYEVTRKHANPSALSWNFDITGQHYSDGIRSTIASQIECLLTIKENNKALRHWPLWGESVGDRWIPLTKASDGRHHWIKTTFLRPWWRHQMETFSALLAICAGNSPVPGEFLAQRPVTQSFGVFFDLRLNERFSKQSWGWWFETLSRPLWRHRNGKLVKEQPPLYQPPWWPDCDF